MGWNADAKIIISISKSFFHELASLEQIDTANFHAKAVPIPPQMLTKAEKMDSRPHLGHLKPLNHEKDQTNQAIRQISLPS